MPKTKAIDNIDFAFVCAKYDLDALPDAALAFPDMGDQQGLKFWDALAAQCEQLIDAYPDLADYICSLYAQVWDIWSCRRDN